MSAADPVMRIFNRIATIIFIILNIFALLIGIALIICGIIVCVAYRTPGLHPIDYVVILFEAVLFFTGALLAIAFSVFGFVAAHIRSRQLLLVYAVIVLIIAILELAVGIYLFVHHEKIFTEVENGLTVAMHAYGLAPQATVFLDYLQGTYDCCGVNSAEDWRDTVYYKVHSALPDPCCANMTTNQTTCQIGGPDTHERGCYTFLQWFMTSHYEMLASLFVVAGCVQLLCVVMALWMLFYWSKQSSNASESTVKTPLKVQCVQCLSKVCPCIAPTPDVPSSI